MEVRKASAAPAQDNDQTSCLIVCLSWVQSLLDGMEVCLAAMKIPLAAVDVPVDFDNLPTVKLPSSSLAAVEASPEDSAGEGTGLHRASDDEILEEDPQEELGDSSTLR